MEIRKLRRLIQDIQSGKINTETALERLRGLPFENIGFANLDHHRMLRTGMPEVIYAPGKTDAQIAKLAGQFKKSGVDVLITRTGQATYRKIKAMFHNATFNPNARIITISAKRKNARIKGTILVVSAGTSDIPVAEEAAITAETLGHEVQRIFDVGVAGIHRLFAHRKQIEKAEVIIVVAGMEGALASVVGGIVSVPVIAVPTSVGYGAAFGGLAALLGMLNSCAPGVVVVNIDNGFGAACAASKIIGGVNE
jgi:NCAIR mutase (PurE)-related protein